MGGFAGLTAAAICSAGDSHPVLHVLRDAIVAHDRPRVPQAATFALDHEAPKRVARLLHELRPHIVSLLLAPVVIGECGKRRLERASQSPEGGSRLLRNLVIERDNGACSGRAAGDGHLRSYILAPSALPRDHRNAGSGIELASRSRLKAVARQHIFRRGAGADFGKRRNAARDRNSGNAGKMEGVVERQEKAEHFRTADDRNHAVANAELLERLFERGADGIPQKRMWQRRGRRKRRDLPRQDQTLASGGVGTALVRKPAVDNDGGMVERVLEKTLVGVIADRRRHFAFAVREHAVGGYDHKAFDSAH